jgi:hypothetical protein
MTVMPGDGVNLPCSAICCALAGATVGQVQPWHWLRTWYLSTAWYLTMP